MVGAVIYVRVSTKEQTENLSLPTQLRACEEYYRRQGYEILARFHEEGESAKSTDRSQLQNLLTFCRLNKGRVHFVVVLNLTRFARLSTTTSPCGRICSRLASRCARRRSPSTTPPPAS
jgi:DNA invertase Pin-like site-specific DNA recombinase